MFLLVIHVVVVVVVAAVVVATVVIPCYTVVLFCSTLFSWRLLYAHRKTVIFDVLCYVYA